MMLSFINKLSVQTGILIFVSLTGVLGATFWFEYQTNIKQLPITAEHQADVSSRLIAASISDNVRYAKAFQIWNQMNQIQVNFRNNSQINLTEYAVLNDHYIVLAHSSPEQHPVMKSMRIPKHGLIRNKYDIQITQPIYHTSDGRVIGYLVLKFYAQSIPKELHALKVQLFSIFAIVLLFSIILAVGMSYRVSTPLKQLTRLARHVGSGDVETSNFSNKPHEIQLLANAMQHADQSIVQANHELADNQALLKSILDHSPAIICIKDTQGRYTLTNKRFDDILHLKAKDIIGKTDNSIFSSHTAQELHDHDIEVLTRKKGITTEETLLYGGQHHHYLSLKFPLFDQQGHIESVCCIATDITEQKKAQSNMMKLVTAIDQADELVVLTDKDGVIDYVNKAFEHISGYQADEVIGNTPAMLKSGHHSASYYDSMWQSLHAGEVWHGDFVNKKKNGDTYEVTQSITPIKNESGDIVGFSSVQRDVTHMRRVQDKLQHMDRVESLGVLAGGIAHDFNNLLTAILGNASLAANKTEPHSPALRYLNSIEVASHSAADLCRQMLAYSGKGKFVVEEVNISELVENMCTLIDVSIAKNVVLKYDLGKQIPAIRADVAQIKQIILNLITNASEAIDDKSGVISVATGVMQVDAEYLNGCISAHELKQGRYVYLEVSDTGSGMSEEVQKKIFDPFFTTKFTGRGLGMSAMLGIVQGHQAGLRIYSEVDKGTTIKIAFPIAHEQSIEADTNTELRAATWKSTGTILVVDDEETLREVASFMLEDMGFEVITANDGLEGVQAYQQHQDDIQLVLLDMTMPKMDGQACFRELRNINPDVRVLLSSGYNERDATGRFAGKGLAGFIQKPYSANTLASKLKEILGSKPDKS